MVTVHRECPGCAGAMVVGLRLTGHTAVWSCPACRREDRADGDPLNMSLADHLFDLITAGQGAVTVHGGLGAAQTPWAARIAWGPEATTLLVDPLDPPPPHQGEPS